MRPSDYPLNTQNLSRLFCQGVANARLFRDREASRTLGPMMMRGSIRCGSWVSFVHVTRRRRTPLYRSLSRSLICMIPRSRSRLRGDPGGLRFSRAHACRCSILRRNLHTAWKSQVEDSQSRGNVHLDVSSDGRLRFDAPLCSLEVMIPPKAPRFISSNVERLTILREIKGETCASSLTEFQCCD